MGRNFERPAQSRQIAVRRVALQYPTKAHACACLNAVQRVGALPHRSRMVRVFVLGGTGSVGSAVGRGLARSDASAAARRIWRDIRLGVAGTKTSCYAFMMTAKKLKDVLQRVETWPE